MKKKDLNISFITSNLGISRKDCGKLELSEIFEPSSGFTPKILSCSLRLTEKSNQSLKITKITKLRIAQRMLIEILSQAEMNIKNYARKGFSAAQKLFVASLLTLRVVQQEDMWLRPVGLRPNLLSQTSHIPKTLGNMTTRGIENDKRD